MLENCVGVLYQRDMNKEKKLNNEQKEAVEFGEGPLLIIAGAGTGKTTVITERIKHLISSGLASSSEILALTFTEKAAAEMEERVDRLMPYGYTDMWICTFHSFCDRILRESAIQLGYDSGFTLMTEAQSVQFVKNNLFEFDLNYFRPLGNPNKFIEGLLTHFSRLADENISFAEYIRWAEMLIEKIKNKVRKKN
jgi:DNA helicase-2/ATP-dependent DNA helicase PcrA